MNDLQNHQIPDIQRLAESWTPQRTFSWASKRSETAWPFPRPSAPRGWWSIDMASRVRKTFRLFTIDTEFLFPETYNLMDRIEEKYGIAIEQSIFGAVSRRASNARTALRCGPGIPTAAAIFEKLSRSAASLAS